MGRRGGLGSLAAPVAGMIEAPLPDALDMHVAKEWTNLQFQPGY
jgi:hypothetical protein